MTQRQIEKWNRVAEHNKSVVRSLWEKLGRKPSIEDIEKALAENPYKGR